MIPVVPHAQPARRDTTDTGGAKDGVTVEADGNGEGALTPRGDMVLFARGLTRTDRADGVLVVGVGTVEADAHTAARRA